MSKSIAILAPSSVPFQVGGSEKFWWGLRAALGAWSGAFTELIKVPCREENWDEIISSYETFSRINLDHFDMLITTKYPAWMSPHPNHICYMQHTLRGLYDTYVQGLPQKLINPPAALRDLLNLIRKAQPTRDDLGDAFELCKKARAIKSIPSSMFAFPGPLLREIVHFFDRVAFAKDQIKAWLAISGTVAARPDYFPENAAIKILPHPSDLTNFKCGEGKYFFTASRLNHSKRIRLLLDAMARVPLDIPLKIAGTGPEADFLREYAASDPRIEFLGHVPDSELPELYAGAIAVLFAPYQEDYGLITIEAMKSGKPIITASDSGGVCEFVRDGKTGFVAEPTAPSLAQAICKLGQNLELAAQMGDVARGSVEFINWRATVEELLGFVEAQKAGAKIEPLVVVAAPFGADAHGAGGPRRLHYFCKELARKFEVVLLCIGSQTQKLILRREVVPHFNEISFPWQEEALAEAESLAENTGESVDDIAIMRHAANHQSLKAELKRIGANAVCAILSHPWLHDAVANSLPDIPLVYDAHNVEATLKFAIFGNSEITRETERLEAALCKKAAIVFACSRADQNSLAKKYGITPDKIRLLPNGCDPDPAIRDKSELRKRLPYPQSRLALFIASAHHPNLEAASAITAMAEKLPEVEFLLAGSVSTQRRIRTAKRSTNVHLLGIISEKTKDVLLRAADIGLNPVTTGSGVNLKSIEYLAAGLPCISTSFGMRGLPDGLEPAVQISSLEAFPDRIRAFFANPPDNGAVEKIAHRIRSEYDWQNTMALLIPEINALRVAKQNYAPSD